MQLAGNNNCGKNNVVNDHVILAISHLMRWTMLPIYSDKVAINSILYATHSIHKGQLVQLRAGGPHRCNTHCITCTHTNL